MVEIIILHSCGERHLVRQFCWLYCVAHHPSVARDPTFLLRCALAPTTLSDSTADRPWHCAKLRLFFNKRTPRDRGVHLARQPCVTQPTMERKDRKARQERNRSSSAALAAVAVIVVSASAATAFAQTPHDEVWTPPPHVRPEPELRALVNEAVLRSPAIRALRDELEALDITVYIRTRVFTQIDLDGHVALLAVNRGHRYLVIELSCSRSTIVQMTALGHELFHAVEIAREPSIVDARSMAAFYARIGIRTGDTIGRETFETDAAASVGRRARRELLQNTTRSGHGS
jgi:hypothetical protein